MSFDIDAFMYVGVQKRRKSSCSFRDLVQRAQGSAHLEKNFDNAVSGGKVANEGGSVQGHVAAPRTVERTLFGKQRRHFVLKMAKR